MDENEDGRGLSDTRLTGIGLLLVAVLLGAGFIVAVNEPEPDGWFRAAAIGYVGSFLVLFAAIMGAEAVLRGDRPSWAVDHILGAMVAGAMTAIAVLMSAVIFFSGVCAECR